MGGWGPKWRHLLKRSRPKEFLGLILLLQSIFSSDSLIIYYYLNASISTVVEGYASDVYLRERTAAHLILAASNDKALAIVIQSKKITWQLFINSEKNHLPKEQIFVILFLQFPLTDHRKALMPWRQTWLSWCEPRLHIMPKAFSACANCFYETIKPSAWSLSLYLYAVRPMKDLIFSTN